MLKQLLVATLISCSVQAQTNILPESNGTNVAMKVLRLSKPQTYTVDGRSYAVTLSDVTESQKTNVTLHLVHSNQTATVVLEPTMEGTSFYWKNLHMHAFAAKTSRSSNGALQDAHLEAMVDYFANPSLYTAVPSVFVGDIPERW